MSGSPIPLVWRMGHDRRANEGAGCAWRRCLCFNLFEWRGARFLKLQKTNRMQPRSSFIFSVGLAVALSSCSISNYVSTERGVYSWENSNARLIEKSVPCERVVSLVDSAIVGSDRLVIVSEETATSGDGPLLSGIETQLIKSFVDHGVLVLERDEDMISKVISESSDRYHVVRGEKSRHSGVASSVVNGSSYGAAGSHQQGTNASYASAVQGGSGAVSFGVENWSRLDSTSLISATKILSYRVLECGIQKTVNELSPSIAEEAGRRAQTVLDVKLIDAKSGQILLAERATGIHEHVPEKGEVRIGEDPRFKYYSFGRPLQNGNPQEQTLKTEDVPPPTKPFAKLVGLVLTLVFIGVVAA